VVKGLFHLFNKTMNLTPINANQEFN